jgi:N-hydroxyarylamine O-acetyltransferase
MTEFDTAAYLQRIGLDTQPAASVDGLHALQRAQALAIPFENFDILLERGISLEPQAVFDKLVHRRRGGYCFELNGLFLAALQAFGFQARALLGRVHVVGEPTGRSHQISLVSIDGEDWIADVGFGAQTALQPMRLVRDEPQALHDSVRRYVDDPRFGTMLQMQGPERWINLYSFDFWHVTEGDRVMGNHFTSTHPGSFFTFARIAARPTPTGRRSLLDFTLRQVDGGAEATEQLAGGEAYLTALREHFGIELGAPYDALRPTREDALPASLSGG